MRYYYVMEMPLSADGQGPVTDGTHAKMTWEVWNQIHETIASYETLQAAERAANVLNEDMEAAIASVLRTMREPTSEMTEEFLRVWRDPSCHASDNGAVRLAINAMIDIEFLT